MFYLNFSSSYKNIKTSRQPIKKGKSLLKRSITRLTREKTRDDRILLEKDDRILCGLTGVSEMTGALEERKIEGLRETGEWRTRGRCIGPTEDRRD